MFGQICKGCGETYYPVSGLDSGHGGCVGKPSDIPTFANWDDEVTSDTEDSDDDSDSENEDNIKPVVKCKRCHRELHAQSSIVAGYGKVCAKRERQERAAAAASISQDTVTRAHEDIEDGAVQPTTFRTRTGGRIYLAISSDGSQSYLPTKDSCTCLAGQHDRMCHHRTAVILLVA